MGASRRSDKNRTSEKAGEGGPASWDRDSSYAHDRGRPTDLHQIEPLALFAGNFLINIDVFLPCVLTLD